MWAFDADIDRSRSGLLVFVVGSYFMLLAKAGFTARFAITALVGVIVLVIGTSDRSEAWADLVGQIAERPKFG